MSSNKTYLGYPVTICPPGAADGAYDSWPQMLRGGVNVHRQERKTGGHSSAHACMLAADQRGVEDGEVKMRSLNSKQRKYQKPWWK